VKVLCVDHGAVLRGYRGRYVEIARQAPDLDLTVVAPRALREPNYLGQLDQRDTSEFGYRLEFASYRPGKAHRGFYEPFRLASLIRHIKPDIIHTQGEPEALSSGEICLLRDVLSSRSTFVFVSWSNIDLYRTGWPYRLGALYDRCYRFVLRRADAATVYCEDAARILSDNGFLGRVARIPWGVDPAVFRRVASTQLREDLGLKGLVLGFVGRLERPKGVATLIRAAARTGMECSLLVAGNGSALAEWRELASNVGVSVRWVGQRPPNIGRSSLARS
jgi:glycosyltransferase involved in cell wall biosynthesis